MRWDCQQTATKARQTPPILASIWRLFLALLQLVKTVQSKLCKAKAHLRLQHPYMGSCYNGADVPSRFEKILREHILVGVLCRARLPLAERAVISSD